MLDRRHLKVRNEIEWGNPSKKYLLLRKYLKLLREADSWKRSSTWYLVSISRRNYKFKCIWVFMKWLKSQDFKIDYLYCEFYRLITIDEMKRLTRSEECSELIVDSLYLSWTTMKWNFIGKVREFNVDKSELCSTTDDSISVFFPWLVLYTKNESQSRE